VGEEEIEAEGPKVHIHGRRKGREYGSRLSALSMVEENGVKVNRGQYMRRDLKEKGEKRLGWEIGGKQSGRK
jgi:hypothetical protein